MPAGDKRCNRLCLFGDDVKIGAKTKEEVYSEHYCGRNVCCTQRKGDGVHGITG